MNKTIIFILTLLFVAAVALAGQNITQDANRTQVVIFTEFTTGVTSSVAAGENVLLRWSKPVGSAATSSVTYVVPADKFFNVQAMAAACHPTSASTTTTQATIKFYANGNKQGSEKIAVCNGVSTSSANEFPDFPISIDGGLIYGPSTTFGVTVFNNGWTAPNNAEIDITIYGYEY